MTSLTDGRQRSSSLNQRGITRVLTTVAALCSGPEPYYAVLVNDIKEVMFLAQYNCCLSV